MRSDLSGRTILGILPEGATGPSRSALLLALIDRARHNRAFGQELQHDTVTTTPSTGTTPCDSTWSGRRDLLTG